MASLHVPIVEVVDRGPRGSKSTYERNYDSLGRGIKSLRLLFAPATYKKQGLGTSLITTMYAIARLPQGCHQLGIFTCMPDGRVCAYVYICAHSTFHVYRYLNDPAGTCIKGRTHMLLLWLTSTSFAIPASTAPSERVFTTAKNIQQKKKMADFALLPSSRSHHVKKLWTSMYNSAYNCDFKNLIAPLNSLGTLEIYQVIKTAN